MRDCETQNYNQQEGSWHFTTMIMGTCGRSRTSHPGWSCGGFGDHVSGLRFGSKIAGRSFQEDDCSGGTSSASCFNLDWRLFFWWFFQLDSWWRVWDVTGEITTASLKDTRTWGIEMLFMEIWNPAARICWTQFFLGLIWSYWYIWSSGPVFFLAMSGMKRAGHAMLNLNFKQ